MGVPLGVSCVEFEVRCCEVDVVDVEVVADVEGDSECLNTSEIS